MKILNPYKVPGVYRKAQLHLHTSQSIDVRKKIPVEQTIRLYQQAGYSFIVITDHDRVTNYSSLNNTEFLVIPGMEKTVVAGIWPLGKHLICIGVSENQPSNSLCAPAHPNWPGNFWTGRWRFANIQRIPNLRLIEIFNRHSPIDKDVLLWHRLLAERGFMRPIWGIAVDDTDNGTPLDLGWIMIKTIQINQKAFMDSLYQGSFYATCGPSVEFDVKDGLIHASTVSNTQIRFINAFNRTVAEFSGLTGAYRPETGDGFIRVEVTDDNRKNAWSQPFFIVKN